MLKNKIVVLVIIFSIVLLIVGIVIVYNEMNNNDEIISIVEEKLNLIISGNYLEANFEFIDNYNNKTIAKNYLNMSNEQLTDNGYIEYIQSTDYMIKFYNKIQIQEVSIKEENEKEIICSVKIKRPNLIEIMDECDNENLNNEDYKFNEAFINKLDLNKFKYYEGTYEILLKKVGNEIKFKYDDNFKVMLYC